MQVILLQDVRGVGKKDDVKNVPDGYARNFLLARNLAVPATAGALMSLKTRQSRRAEDDARTEAHLRELANRLKKEPLEFTLKTDNKGSVFGSVTQEMIEKALQEKGLAVTVRPGVKLDHPIREFGEHKLTADLKKGIRAEILVIVRPRP